MAYIWKFHSHRELVDAEEKDIQLCITEAERISFRKNLSRCIEDDNFSFKVESESLPTGTPYHIDAPATNFFFPHTPYRSLTICSSGFPQDVIVDSSDLRLELTKASLHELIRIINETERAPALYENVLELNSTASQKIVSWGSYEEKPIYF